MSDVAVLSRADGSSRFTLGRTAVLCSVTGPIDVKPKNELLDRAFLDVVVRPATGLPGTHEKVLEQALHGALDACVLATLHPRTTIQVVVQVLHNDGSLLAAAVNGCVLALLDAGVALRSTVVCASGGLLALDSDEQLVANMTQEQEQAALATFCAAFAGASPDPVMLSCAGSFTQEQLVAAVASLHEAALAVERGMRETLERRFKRQLRKK
eukprot:Unigene7300_Nuclearia_a/m.22421 Unigene7300_Nuclearia_a/g.22421  ORF Unigene7300_Nuclearia_a/g.22421 Unigene7300_Nuclearia_a/m.22421 type:complete len:212 (-) Unigene7300_Nuclearia_a:38-673(-)